MGTIFKKTVTRPLPAGAEIVTRQGARIARWKVRGKTRTAPIITGQDGTDRIRVESSTFIAKYRDGSNLVVEVPTGCRTEDAARQVLADLERQAERQRAGLITASEARTAEHLGRPIGEHVEAYLNALTASGSVEHHRRNVRIYLKRLGEDCGFARLADLTRDTLEGWLATESKRGRSARSRNTHRASAVAFAGWCVETGRLMVNPFKGVPKADEKSDPRRQRRAMTEDELTRLLDVARRRPLLEALTVRKGQRKGEAYANVRPEVRRQLDTLGQERALIYKTLVLTGLRRGELASITVGQLHLEGPTPGIELKAGDAKSREAAYLPLRSDLAADLAQWLTDRLEWIRDEARAAGRPLPVRLPDHDRLFTVPVALVKILDRDLKLAGIPKRDERGRTLDVHAFRHTFGTLLSKGGVPLRTAQAAMRHSDPSLTANVYTDPKLLDIGGALDALPALPLDSSTGTESQRATGTAPSFVAPTVAPTWCNAGQTERRIDNMMTGDTRPKPAGGLAVSPCFDKGKGPVTSHVTGPHSVCPRGFEPLTFSSGGYKSSNASDDLSQVTSSDSARCTARCTSNAPDANDDPLLAFVASLSPEQRQRLAELLTGGGDRGGENYGPEAPTPAGSRHA